MILSSGSLEPNRLPFFKGENGSEFTLLTKQVPPMPGHLIEEKSTYPLLTAISVSLIVIPDL